MNRCARPSSKDEDLRIWLTKPNTLLVLETTKKALLRCKPTQKQRSYVVNLHRSSVIMLYTYTKTALFCCKPTKK